MALTSSMSTSSIGLPVSPSSIVIVVVVVAVTWFTENGKRKVKQMKTTIKALLVVTEVAGSFESSPLKPRNILRSGPVCQLSERGQTSSHPSLSIHPSMTHGPKFHLVFFRIEHGSVRQEFSYRSLVHGYIRVVKKVVRKGKIPK